MVEAPSLETGQLFMTDWAKTLENLTNRRSFTFSKRQSRLQKTLGTCVLRKRRGEAGTEIASRSKSFS